MNDVISREAADAILRPHRDAISLCLHNGWDRWSNDTTLPTSVRPGTRANLVYDYAVSEAWRILNGRTGLSLSEQRGFLLVNVEDALLLRFKKFRKGLATSGIPTAQAQLFAHQLRLDNMPALTHIVAGYLLDQFDRTIARAAVTCNVGSLRIWTIDLPRPDEDVGTVVGIESPSGEPPPTTVRSAFPRRTEADQEAT